MKRFLGSIKRSKAERSSKETEKNVDNRIQYVGQIAREGKLSKKGERRKVKGENDPGSREPGTNKKPKSRNKPSDKEKDGR